MPGASRENRGLSEFPTLLSNNIALSSIALSHILMSSGHTMVEVEHLVAVASKRYRPETRSLMLATLANLGPEARIAVPKLWPLLHDGNAHVRLFAASAIIEITRDQSLASSVARLLTLDEQERAAFVGKVVTGMQEREADERELLDAALDDPGEYVTMLILQMQYAPGPYRRSAMRSLADLGRVAQSAVPELRRQLCSTDPETRALAMRALLRIAPRFAAADGAEKRIRRIGRPTRFGVWGMRRGCSRGRMRCGSGAVLGICSGVWRTWNAQHRACPN